LNLTDLIALNDEIRALVRAGVPLDEGLAAIAQDTPGALGQRVEELGRRLRDGESLSQVLADPNWGVPPVYQAIIAAGTRAGRLEVALEGIATSARLQLETRRLTTTALIYPVIVLYVSYGVFVLLVAHVLPRMLLAHEELLQQHVAALDWITPWSESVHRWAPWPPLLFAGFLLYRWWRSGRLTVSSAGNRSWFSISPGRTRELGALATFSEVLALLIEHAVPMPEALVLAAEASGGTAMRTWAREFAELLRRGEQWSPQSTIGMPTWLAWLASNPSLRLPAQLRLAARQYRDEAFRVSELLTQLLPFAATAIVGGLAVLSYGLLLFVPLTQLLSSLGAP